MKKRKILYLFPLAALILSGCTFQEGWESVKGFATDSVYEPVKGFFENLFGKKTEAKEEKKEEEQKPGPGVAGDDPGDEVPDTEVGSLTNPLSIAEFQAKVDELIKFEDVESGKSLVDSSHLFYLKAKVRSNSAANDYGEINFLNLTDGTLEVTGFWPKLDSSLDEKYKAQDSMVGSEVIVKGYGALMKKGANDTKVYEIMKKDNDHKAVVVQVIEPELDPKYGTPDNPLTVSEAKALIDEEKPTQSLLYVTGTVSSNTAYSSQYKNLDIIISDGTNSLKIFRCGTFPATDDITAITQNSLKGRTVVAKGTGDYYADNSEYEITSPTVLSITGEGPAVVTIDNYGTKDAPLTIVEAMDVIDKEDPTKQDLYVTGTVQSNSKWNVGNNYANIDIVITDGNNHEFTIFRADTLPAEFDNNKPTENSLIGKRVVAHGTGTIYGAKYELNSGCKVDSVTDQAAPEKDVKSIAIQTNPKTSYYVGDLLDLSAMVIRVTYTDDTTFDITSGYTTNIALDHELTKEDTTLVVTYKEKTASVALTVTDKPTDPEKGTAENPYTVSEAKAVFDELETGANTDHEVYVQGTIASNPAPTVSGGRGRFYLSDGVSETDMYVYNVNNIGGSNNLITAEIPYGSSVVVKGAIKNYNDGFQLCYVQGTANCELISIERPELTSVTISGTPSKTEYVEEASYTADGLVATANYANGATGDCSTKATWSLSKETAELGDTSFTVTATYNNVVSAAFTVNVTVTQKPVVQNQITAELDLKTYATANNISSGTKVSSIALDSVVTAAASGTDSNTGKIYIGSDATEWRFYGSGNGKLTITVSSGYILDSVTIGKATSNYGTPVDFEMTVANNQAEFTSSSNFNVKTIVVLYHAA